MKMVDFDVMNKQATVHQYSYTSSWNDQWMMQLKAIEA